MNRFGVIVAIWIEYECGCINNIKYLYILYAIQFTKQAHPSG